MAKKRLNTQFVVILLGGAVLVGGGAVVGMKFFSGNNPAKLKIGADAAFAKGDFSVAYDTYSRVVGAGKPSAELLVRLGDAARLANISRPDLNGADRKAWELALQADPNYLPALQRLLSYWQSSFNIAPSVDSYNRVRDFAERVAKADPTDKKAPTTISITVLQAWLRDLSVDEERVAAEVKLLEETSKANPTDDRLPPVICAYYVKRATEAAKNGRKTEFEAAIKSTVEFADQAGKAGEQTLAVQVKLLPVYAQLGFIDRPNADRYNQKFIATLDRARGMAKPEEPLYLETMLYAADRAATSRNRDEARKIFDELIEKRPNDLSARLAYGQWLGQDKASRPQAVELLSREIVRQADANDPFAQLRLSSQEQSIRMLLTTTRIDMLGDAPNEEAKAKLKKDIEESITKLDNDLRGAPQVMRIRGRYQLVQGRNKDAIETLEAARLAIGGNPRLQADIQLRSEVLGMLAQAYLNVAQNGTAKPILRELSTIAPNPAMVHKMLFQVASQEADVETMKTEYGILKKIAPTDPDLARIEFVVLNATKGNKAELRKRYDAMPERTLNDLYAKSRAAQAIDPPDYKDAEALLRKCLEQKPNSPEVLRDLARVLVVQNRQADAEIVVKKAIADNPTDLQLKVLLVAVQKKSPAEIQKAISDAVDDEKDEFTRERRRYELAYAQNDLEEGRKHVLRMYELKPDDKAAIDPYFTLLLVDKKYGEAEKLLERIASKDLDEAGGRIYRFQLLMATGKRTEALGVAREVVSKLGEFSQSYVLMGKALAGQEPPDYLQALQNFEIAIERQPNNAEALRLAIDANLRLNRPDDAKKYIDQAMRVRAGDPAFRDAALQWEVRYGDAEKVIPTREEAVKNRPEVASNWTNLAAAYVSAAQKKATAGDGEKARALSDKALEAMLTAVEKAPEEPAVYQSLAGVAVQATDATKAIAAIEAMAKRPTFAKSGAPMALVADVYSRRNQPEQAEKAYKGALETEPANIGIRMAYSAFLSKYFNRLPDAIKVLDGATAEQRDNVFHQRMMELYAKAGKVGEGEAYVRKLLGAKPENLTYQNLLTMCLVNGGRYKDAQDQANKTLASATAGASGTATTDEADVARYYRAVTVLRLNTTDIAPAITDLQQLRDKSPGNLEVRLALAEAFRRTNDTESALNELRAALTADPRNKSVRLKMVQFCTQALPPRWSEAERLLADAIVQPELARDPDIYAAVSDMWIARKEPLRAVDFIRKAVELAPGNANVIRTYLGVLIQAGNPDQVILETDALMKEGADAAWINQMRGAARALQRKQAEAITEYETALNKAYAAKDNAAVDVITRAMASDVGYEAAVAHLAPRVQSDPKLATLLAVLHMSGGHQELAIQAISPLLDKVDTLPVNEQAMVLQAAGTVFIAPGPNENIEKGYDCYKKLLVINPDNMTALNNMASLLTDRFSPPRAKEALQYSQRLYTALQQMGQFDPTLLDTHGWTLVLSDQISEGTTILQDAADRATRTGKPFPEVHYHLAQAYFKTDAPELAKSELERALKVADNLDRQAKANGRAAVDPGLRLKIEIDLKKADEAVAQKKTPKR